MKNLFCILLFLIPFAGVTQLTSEQEHFIDSLQNEIDNAEHDSIIINAWVAWDNLIYISDPELDFELNEKIEALCSEKLKENPSAVEKMFFSKKLSFSINNIGILYDNKGDYVRAIGHYTRSLTIREEIGDLPGVSASLNNIGLIYLEQENSDKAIDYFTRALKIDIELGDYQGVSTSYINIGIIYKNEGDLAKAIEYYSKSLKIYEESGNLKGSATAYNNIAGVHKVEGDVLLKDGEISLSKEKYTKAIDYYTKSLNLKEEMGDMDGMSTSLNNIGTIYHDIGNFPESIKYCKRALHLAQEVEAEVEVKHAAETLYDCYSSLDRYKLALTMYELFIETKDSLDSETNQKAFIRQEYKYIYEKQAAADSITNAEAQKVKDALLTAEKAENKHHQIEAKQQRQQAYLLYGGLGLALLFGGFIFNRFRVTSKQKLIIEDQKDQVDKAFEELEEKNKEIMDSIAYAKRIQSAILPPAKLVKEYLQESFILYKPKDIVAGDFYWLEHKEGKILFAAADCTGHGVPGAMVSVVCNNGLNRSVREYGLTEPGKILDKTREIVIQEFEKSEDEVKDGMDIALCSLEGNILKYAGAHNPLWIIRNGEVLETKADKQPIGKFDKQSDYSTHIFELEKGDSVYIFSDGYVDQFGGEKGKKFKSKAFRNLLLSIQDKPMEKQRILIDNAFETWRGSLEQIDDVCVIGVRI